MAVDGTPKFSTLAIGEVAAEFKGNSTTLSCKAAFGNRETNATHAWTKGEGAIWSQETMECLARLRELMEQDMARLHFHDVAPAGVARPPSHHVGGLMEHLSKEEADQA